MLGFVLCCMAFIAVWVRQLSTRNAGMVDPVWSWSMGAMGVLYALAGSADFSSRVMVGVIAGAWGVRLGTHLYLRNAGKPEDGRYRRLREDWGDMADRRMLQFFIFQAVAASILSLGMWAVCWHSVVPEPWQIVSALILAALSLGGEALADFQLERFRSQPENKGRVCRTGLWGWSRHPNYFFECMHWVCYILLAWGSPWVLLTCVPPVVMAWLLLKVSGIPANEAEAAAKRPEYAEYIRTTSAFIPFPPRRS
jgi:hypothetical protein